MANPKKDIPAEVTTTWEAEKDNFDVDGLMFQDKAEEEPNADDIAM